MFLKEIKGNLAAIQILQRALQGNRVAHAYLFCGPGKCGKTTTAHAFAQAYLCEQSRQLGDSCGLCSSCMKFIRENHPDLKLIEPLGASLKIEQIRDLRQQVYIKAYNGLGKVYLLTKVETMTTEAANSFLKILEEPPEGVLFLLVSAKPYDLLPTITSRCQIIQFSSLDNPLTAQSSEDFVQKRVEILKIAEKLITNDFLAAFQIAEELDNKGKNKQELVETLDLLAIWYRDLLIWKTTDKSELLINADLCQIIQESSSRVSIEGLMKNVQVIEQTKEYLNTNVNTRLALENMLIDLLGGYK